jgi:hypothetical protein
MGAASVSLTRVNRRTRLAPQHADAMFLVGGTRQGPAMGIANWTPITYSEGAQ